MSHPVFGPFQQLHEHYLAGRLDQTANGVTLSHGRIFANKTYTDEFRVSFHVGKYTIWASAFRPQGQREWAYENFFVKHDNDEAKKPKFSFKKKSPLDLTHEPWRMSFENVSYGKASFAHDFLSRVNELLGAVNHQQALLKKQAAQLTELSPVQNPPSTLAGLSISSRY